MGHATTPYKLKTVNEKENSLKLGLGVNQGSITLQDPRGVIDHIIDDLLSGEDLAYLNSCATGGQRPGAGRLLRMLLEVDFVGDDTSLEKSFGFGLTIILPEGKEVKLTP